MPVSSKTRLTGTPRAAFGLASRLATLAPPAVTDMFNIILEQNLFR